ncbi:glycosyltransferase [Lacticaseibacillus thailandensis]|uniref:glycosyltransferase n=1 Tax=Lacticaseibacillus thailandensis TaxID=381741 RepID=UPI0006D001A9|nr:glycosyltransferase family 2 protein [Lacticaseibacillus thailandensis]
MIGIVVLNYNTWEESRKCVESLLNINEYKDIFIYIVDNHSTVVAPEKFVDFINADSRTELIWNTKNSGYNAGNNVGIRKALQDGCDYILVSNNDVTYDQDTIRSMVSMFSLHPDVGIVGPKIIEGNGSIQEINMLVPTTLGGKYKYLLGHTPFKRIVRKYINTFSADRSNLSAPFYVSSVSGACLLISRECCQAIFPFDEFPFFCMKKKLCWV